MLLAPLLETSRKHFLNRLQYSGIAVRHDEQWFDEASSDLELLAEMGAAAAELAGELPPLFDSDDVWVSVRSAVAHWRLVGDPQPVVPVLLEHLEYVPRGLVAVHCLTEIGPPAQVALPRLREAVDSQERQVVSGSVGAWIEMDETWQSLCREAIASIER